MDVTLGSLNSFEMSGGNIVMRGDYADRINGCMIGSGTLCDGKGSSDGYNTVGIKTLKNGTVGSFNITGGSMLMTKTDNTKLYNFNAHTDDNPPQPIIVPPKDTKGNILYPVYIPKFADFTKGDIVTIQPTGSLSSVYTAQLKD
jgi:hypothetical protein